MLFSSYLWNLWQTQSLSVFLEVLCWALTFRFMILRVNFYRWYKLWTQVFFSPLVLLLFFICKYIIACWESYSLPIAWQPCQKSIDRVKVYFWTIIFIDLYISIMLSGSLSLYNVIKSDGVSHSVLFFLTILGVSIVP